MGIYLRHESTSPSITEVHTERVDDIPLLGGLLDKMNLQPIIDSIIHRMRTTGG